MASIVKRGTGYSVVYRYEDELGQSKQKWKKCSTYKEAQKVKADIEHGLTAGTFVAPASQTGQEFLLGLGRIAVTPAVFVIRPADAAVFTDEDGSSVVDLPLGSTAIDLIGDDALVDLGVVRGKLHGILLVVVNVVNVGALGGVRTARCDNGTCLVDCLGNIVDGVEKLVALRMSVLIPRLVERTPTNNRRMVKIPF